MDPEKAAYSIQRLNGNSIEKRMLYSCKKLRSFVKLFNNITKYQKIKKKNMRKIKYLQLLIKTSVIVWLIIVTSGNISAHCNEKQIKKKFKELEAIMSPNDTEIKKADRTHDLIERLRVRKIIIDRSRNAAKTAEEYHMPDVAERYRDYKKHVEHNLPAIEKDLKKRFQEMDNALTNYEAQINAVEHSSDFWGRQRLYQNIIGSSKSFADYAERYTHVTNKGHRRMSRYRNFQRYVEGKLAAVEATIAEIQRQENAAREQQIAAEKAAAQEANRQKPISEEQEPQHKNKEEAEQQRKAKEESERQEAERIMTENLQKVENDESIQMKRQENTLLKAIKIDLSMEDITFELESKSYIISIKSQLNLLKEYVEKNGLYEKNSELENVDPNSLIILGLEDQSEESIKVIVSYIADILPVLKTTESIGKIIANHKEDVNREALISGYKISWNEKVTWYHDEPDTEKKDEIVKLVKEL